MDKEKFFDMLGEYDNLKVYIYADDEIISKFDMDIVHVEEYGDEIVVRGTGTAFISLQGDPELDEVPFEDTEYIFKNGSTRIGVIFC